MKEENDKLRLCVVLLLSIIASIFILIFSIPKANALVIKESDVNTVVNGTTYYGFDVPTRTSGAESQSYINVGTQQYVNSSGGSFYSNSKYFIYNSNNRKFYYDDLDNYIEEQHINLDNINMNMTTPIDVGPSDKSNIMKLWFNFHPALEGDQSQMFSLGNYFDYNGYYTFDFDIVLYNYYSTFGDNQICNTYQSNGSLVISNVCSSYSGFMSGNVNSLGTGGTSSLGPGLVYSNSNNNLTIGSSTGNLNYGYRVSSIYQDTRLQVLHYTILFNQYSKFKFGKSLFYDDVNNEFLSDVDSYVFYTSGFSIPSSYFQRNVNISEFYPTKLFVSQPYNMKYWVTSNKVYCEGSSCWTQNDTNENSDNKENLQKFSDESFFNEMIHGIDSLIDIDYGFTGIVHKTFDFIVDTLNVVRNHPNTCYSVNVNFFGKDIYLPCGSSFWNRNDVAGFVTTYNIIFTGALCYLLCWKIYKDLLSTFSPSGKIISGNEVDSL